MSVFCEQLVAIKKGAKFYLCAIGALLILAAVMVVLTVAGLGILAPVTVIAGGYGAYYLIGNLMIEYEYIVTTGTMDIDIIYAKRSRKRLLNFELPDVESIEKYNGEPIDLKNKNIIVACDLKLDGVYKITISKDNNVRIAYIMPNERTKQEMLKYVPKFVGNKAFI